MQIHLFLFFSVNWSRNDGINGHNIVQHYPSSHYYTIAPLSRRLVGRFGIIRFIFIHSLILFANCKLYCFQLTAKNIFIKTFTHGKSLQQKYSVWPMRPRRTFLFHPHSVWSPSTLYHFLFQQCIAAHTIACVYILFFCFLLSFSFGRCQKPPFHSSTATCSGPPVYLYCYLNCCNPIALHFWIVVCILRRVCFKFMRIFTRAEKKTVIRAPSPCGVTVPSHMLKLMP